MEGISDGRWHFGCFGPKAVRRKETLSEVYARLGSHPATKLSAQPLQVVVVLEELYFKELKTSMEKADQKIPAEQHHRSYEV